MCIWIKGVMRHAKKIIFNVVGCMFLNANILDMPNTTLRRIKRADFIASVIDLFNEWLIPISMNLSGME